MSHYGSGDNYGRGDYRGGYYGRGDHGIFGSLYKLATKAAGFIPGFGIVKAAAEGLQGLVKTGAHPNLPAPAASFALTGGGESSTGMVPAQQVGMINVGPQGRQTVLINIGTGLQAPAGGPIVRGYHLNKSTYETRGGGTSRWPMELELHPKQTVLVKNRRMNVGNARALKRSLRRIGGFARLARRVMTFTHPRAGRGHFKFHRKKKR